MTMFSLSYLAPLALVLATTPVGDSVANEPAGAGPITVATTDWPWWRGPNRNGVAKNQTPPRSWSASKNILWSSPLPGRGHGSPTIVGDQVVLATAEQESQIQAVICLDRNSGKRLWKTAVHRGGFAAKSNRRSSHASSTVAGDGQRFFINFLHDGAVHTTALSHAGKQIWQTKISDYVVHQGYGSSPVVHDSLVIVAADNKSGGALCGLNRASGKTVWRVDRPATPNYPTPVILSVSGRDRLFLSGCDLVSCFDPLTGKKLWETAGATTECVTTTVTDGQRVFTSGGYPRNHVAAVRADGSGEVVWEKSVRVYVPSMLVRDGHLYAVTDAGIAHCWKSDTGEQVWKERLGGNFTSSPVLVGERIYVTNDTGKTFIFKASPVAFEAIAENEFGDEVFEVYATPTFCDDKIYMRVPARHDGQRQETLYCIADSGQ